MSVFSDLLRSHWLLGINEVSTVGDSGLASWLGRRNFVIHSPIAATGFELQPVVFDDIAPAYAFDASKMSSASFETMAGIGEVRGLPKSLGWFIIQQYYASYFAAHSIMRMLGRNCTMIEGSEIAAVNRIASLYGMSATTANSGYYLAKADHNQGTISFSKMPSGLGSHEFLWREFVILMEDIKASIPNSRLLATDKASALGILNKITEILSREGSAHGNWLSRVRNNTNYRHDYGSWHPYRSRSKYYEGLMGISSKWVDDPAKIPLTGSKDRDLENFTHATTFIVSLNREMVFDMNSRHSERKSFHKNGSLTIYNLAFK